MKMIFTFYRPKLMGLIPILFLFFVSPVLFGQGPIIGVVKDQQSSELPGVSITNKGTAHQPVLFGKGSPILILPSFYKVLYLGLTLALQQLRVEPIDCN